MEERVPKFKILNHANISYSKLKNVIYIYLYIYFTSKRGAASSRKQFLWKIPVLQRKRSRVVFPPFPQGHGTCNPGFLFIDESNICQYFVLCFLVSTFRSDQSLSRVRLFVTP